MPWQERTVCSEIVRKRIKRKPLMLAEHTIYGSAHSGLTEERGAPSSCGLGTKWPFMAHLKLAMRPHASHNRKTITPWCERTLDKRFLRFFVILYILGVYSLGPPILDLASNSHGTENQQAGTREARAIRFGSGHHPLTWKSTGWESAI